MPTSPDGRAAKIMSTQLGLITHAQALACGLTPRQIEHRVVVHRWERLHHSVFVVVGAERSWRQRVLAACLAAGEYAVASHQTAAVLWGLIERRRRPIEVTVPIGKHPRADGYTVHRTRLSFEPEFVGPVPATSAARTVIDLATVVGVDELEEALDIAMRRHDVHAIELLGRLKGLTGRRGLGPLRRMLERRAERGGQNHGVFATRFEQLLRRCGLPPPEIEYVILDADGRFIARVDLCYPREKLVIELDDWDTHSSPRALSLSNMRQNAIEELGYTLRRFTWNDLDRPAYVKGVVARALRARGHPGVSP
ncbi:MAG: hypothetical protein WD826_03405 [Actinomycetota bacterium]